MSSHPDVFVDTIAEGVQRARFSKYAFLLESTMNAYYTARYCSLTKARSSYYSSPPPPLRSQLRKHTFCRFPCSLNLKSVLAYTTSTIWLIPVQYTDTRTSNRRRSFRTCPN